MKILTAGQMRRAEEECVRSGISLETLMENAGKAVAERVRQIPGAVDEKRILLLIYNCRKI